MDKPYKISVKLLLIFTLLIMLGSYRYVSAQSSTVSQTFNFQTREGSERVNGDNLRFHGFPDTIIVWCHDWDSLVTHSTWRDRNKLKSNNTFIKFAVNRYDTITNFNVPFSYNYWLSYELYGYNDMSDTTHFAHMLDTLAIGYNSFSDNTPYQDMSVRKYSNFFKLMLVVNNVMENGVSGLITPVALTPGATLADSAKRNFYVDAAIVTQHYDKMYYGITADSPLITCTNYPGTSDSDYVKLDWAFLSGAIISPINYELEWTFVDDYDVDISAGRVSKKSTSALSYDFRHNATRVWLSEPSFTIPRCNASGYVVYRVRAVRPDSDNYKYPVYGPWSLSSGVDSGNMNMLTVCSDYSVNRPYTQDRLNWQYTASFAESGKFKHVATFYDGLLKNRQSITRSELPDKIIVTDNIYDYEGRLSIKTLPAPTPSGTFSYLHDVSLSKRTRTPYMAADFDSGLVLCPLVLRPPPIDSTALSAFYYSPFNHDTTDLFSRFIPDAHGYPFVQTTFQPGYTDRVAAQSGAGQQLQIGDTNQNYTTNAYVSPAQQNLNALFGTTIGWSSFYNMTVNRDPNQQLSMVVKDYHGKQMASALIGLGPNPANHAIDANNVAVQTFYKQDLLTPSSPNQVVDTIANTRTCDIDFFNQVQATDSLIYSYTFLPFLVCPGLYLSVKGHYHSVVTDQCGNVVMIEDTALGTNGPVAATPITYNSTASFLANPAAYHVHKSLSFYPYDVDNALASVDTAASCFITEPTFIKNMVKNTVFPCPPSAVDSSPCDKMKWEMMRQLLPGAAYGQYSTSSGNVVGTNNSIFSLSCPPDTTYIIHVDTTLRHYNCYNDEGDMLYPYVYGWSWFANSFQRKNDGTSSSVILGYMCVPSLDTSIVPLELEIATTVAIDTFIGSLTYTMTGLLTLAIADTLGFENGAILSGTDSIGYITTIGYERGHGHITEEYMYRIFVLGKLYKTSLTTNILATLPSGKTIYIDLEATNVGYDTSSTYYAYDTVRSVGGIVTGYSASPCYYTTGMLYRYQDTCAVPSLPDTITVAGCTYHNLRTMAADSFIMVYNGAIAEGNYRIAEALLPLHPQYCELQHCFNDTFKTIATAIPDWHVAQSLGLLYLDSFIARDPIIPLMTASGLFPHPQDSLRTFPGGTYTLDTFLFMNAYCACNDRVMFANCVTSMFSTEIKTRQL
ncbi:MAG: repeat protein, partial [Flavipsychrobacter sp.]|nr:repeat protein [Flavipsychrobacter sp.]